MLLSCFQYKLSAVYIWGIWKKWCCVEINCSRPFILLKQIMLDIDNTIFGGIQLLQVLKTPCHWKFPRKISQRRAKNFPIVNWIQIQKFGKLKVTLNRLKFLLIMLIEIVFSLDIRKNILLRSIWKIISVIPQPEGPQTAIKRRSLVEII